MYLGKIYQSGRAFSARADVLVLQNSQSALARSMDRLRARYEEVRPFLHQVPSLLNPSTGPG